MMPTGRLMTPPLAMVTLAVVAAIFGRALALIVVDPMLIALTFTVTLVAADGKVTVAGTVATLVFEELRFTVKPPAGAAPDKVNVSASVPGPVTVTALGEKVSVAPTVTAWVLDVKPGADAVILAEPRLIPLTDGCVVGVVAPAAMNTVIGATVISEVLLLFKVTVTPPAGAAEGREMGNAAEWASPTETFEGAEIGPPVTMVTPAVLSAMFGNRLAWMLAVPIDTPVTGTVALVAPAAKLTVDGTVAAPVLSELRLMVNPLAGAAPDNVSVRFWVVGPVMVTLDGEKLTVAFT